LGDFSVQEFISPRGFFLFCLGWLFFLNFTSFHVFQVWIFPSIWWHIT
jgi:hypothetical protein